MTFNDKLLFYKKCWIIYFMLRDKKVKIAGMTLKITSHRLFFDSTGMETYSFVINLDEIQSITQKVKKNKKIFAATWKKNAIQKKFSDVENTFFILLLKKKKNKTNINISEYIKKKVNENLKKLWKIVNHFRKKEWYQKLWSVQTFLSLITNKWR